MSNRTSNNGIEVGNVLFLIFLVLKLTNQIDWSWWWVTSPLWIPFGIVGVVVVVMYLKYLIKR